MPPFLRVTDLVKTFSVSGGLWQKDQSLTAVDHVSFTLEKGKTLGLVGESGCGKSTTGKLILGLLEPDGGDVELEGVSLRKSKTADLPQTRRRMQMVFQDPFSSLNPRMTVGDIVGEPLKIHKILPGGDIRDRVMELLTRVGLDPSHYTRFPHEFSGGQRQRIGVARALALQPDLIIADEPVSALDLSIQAQIINLLQDLQDEFALTYLVIAHDLSVIEHMSDRVIVMYLGRIVEQADAEDLYRTPRHPYTEALLNAIPTADPRRKGQRRFLSGEPPSPVSPPPGCHFHPRCPYARDLCRTTAPGLEAKGPSGHLAACHFSEDVGKFRAT